MSSYIETIINELHGKLVQVYLGDSHEQIHYTDSSYNVPSVMIGKIQGGNGDCLILNCTYVDEDQAIQDGNIQYINGYNIKCVTPIDGRGTIKDAFASSQSIKILASRK